MAYQIFIKNVLLYGKHGVYPQEKLLDAPFEISITCTLNTNAAITQLAQTINYETIFSITKNKFGTSYDLLETLAYDIIQEIKTTLPLVTKVNINITKLNPPIAAIQGKVGIGLEL